MRKFLLSLVAALFLSVPALAAPYKVVNGAGIPVGPLIGSGGFSGTIIHAPDGTPVSVFVGKAGLLENGTANIQNHMVILYDTPDCSGPAYLDASGLPAEGYFFGPSGASGTIGTVDYPAAPYSFHSVLYSVQNSVCTLTYNNATNPLPVGLGQVFSVNFAPGPFSAVPWTAPDTDPPTQ
jgi:hypothetical protein